jgi:hypothetical protein
VPSRWTSFVADREEEKPRTLTEDGKGWTVLAVDRATRRWAVAQALRQLEAAQAAYARLYDT